MQLEFRLEVEVAVPAVVVAVLGQVVVELRLWLGIQQLSIAPNGIVVFPEKILNHKTQNCSRKLRKLT